MGAQIWAKTLLSTFKWKAAAVIPDSYAGDNHVGDDDGGDDDN